MLDKNIYKKFKEYVLAAGSISLTKMYVQESAHVAAFISRPDRKINTLGSE